MIKTFTRAQVCLFLAAFDSNKELEEKENELIEKIGPENTARMREIENQILRELGEGKTEFTVDIPDDILAIIEPEDNDEEDEEEAN